MFFSFQMNGGNANVKIFLKRENALNYVLVIFEKWVWLQKEPL
jgi:hypothetical protein